MRFETQAVHAGGERDATGAVSPPLHLSTTFEHPPDSAETTGYLYARYGNPTEERLERALAALEGGAAALVYGSGMAAGTALLQSLPAGSHVVMADDCYFSYRTVALEFASRWGVTLDIVDLTDLAAVAAGLRPETRLVWAETPSNPRLKLVDIPALADLAHGHGALLLVDSTFATPALTRPLTLGADFVLHSATKYMGGHSDVQAGALVFGRAAAGAASAVARRDGDAGDLAGRLHRARTLLGPIAAPLSSWLILRGLRTLACRMEWHCRGALRIAEALAEHPAVERVHYPGLASHPQHALAVRQMHGGFGGVLSFEVRGGRGAALEVVGRLGLITSATSLGGVESLIEHRQSVEGAASPSPPNLLRLSVGLEHPADLLADLEQALAAAAR
jgi:cystathionine gamma-synthase